MSLALGILPKNIVSPSNIYAPMISSWANHDQHKTCTKPAQHANRVFFTFCQTMSTWSHWYLCFMSHKSFNPFHTYSPTTLVTVSCNYCLKTRFKVSKCPSRPIPNSLTLTLSSLQSTMTSPNNNLKIIDYSWSYLIHPHINTYHQPSPLNCSNCLKLCAFFLYSCDSFLS